MIQPSPEIAAVVRRWLAADARPEGVDLGRAAAITVNLMSASEHLLYLGTDNDEVFTGDLLRDGYAGHKAEVDPHVLEEARLEAFEHGETGWAMWIGAAKFYKLPDPLDLRMTFVLTLEEGVWKIAHIHKSFPQDNFEAWGGEHHAFADLIAAARETGDALGTEDTATIMFTDIVNSTALAAELGDRAWAQMVGAALAAQGTAIEAAGGRLVKSLGDGTMSAFPSASASVDAAAAIQAATTDHDQGLEIRIGIHSGDVIRAEGDFFGSVVNKAARIAALAGPGEVLVSDVTSAMLDGRPDIRLGAPVPVALRGVEGTHTVAPLILQSDPTQRP